MCTSLHSVKVRPRSAPPHPTSTTPPQPFPTQARQSTTHQPLPQNHKHVLIGTTARLFSCNWGHFGALALHSNLPSECAKNFLLGAAWRSRRPLTSSSTWRPAAERDRISVRRPGRPTDHAGQRPAVKFFAGQGTKKHPRKATQMQQERHRPAGIIALAHPITHTSSRVSPSTPNRVLPPEGTHE